MQLIHDGYKSIEVFSTTCFSFHMYMHSIPIAQSIVECRADPFQPWRRRTSTYEVGASLVLVYLIRLHYLF